MFGSQILDVAIGLVFVYSLFGLLCTVINEWIASLFSLRARTLVTGIRNLIKGKDQEGKELVERFFEHPLIKGLSLKVGRPSYILPRTFAITLMDIIASKEKAGVKVLKDVRGSLEKLPESDVKKALLLIVRDAKEDIEKSTDKIEKWFKDAMDRVKGWYKRKIQLVTFGVAVVVSIGLNVDTFEIANSLYRDETLRASLVAAAIEAVKETESTEQQDSSKIVENVSAKLQEFQLPMGWSNQYKRPSSPRGLLNKVLGWLVTAVALSLGAPFWFDVLNKFIKLRASGKRPEEEERNKESHKKT